MALTPKKGGGDFEMVEPGIYKARLIRVIDLGTQRSEYKGEISYKHKIMMLWELPETKMKEGDNEGKPFSVALFATLSLHKNSNLRPLLVGWRGKDFTPEEEEVFNVLDLLDKTFTISVIHNIDGENTYANIAMLMPLNETECPPRVNDLIGFDLSDFNQQVFDNLSEKLQEKIRSSHEWVDREYRLENGIGNVPETAAEGRVPGDAFKQAFKALPKKTFSAVMELCKEVMGDSDFTNWFVDNGYQAVDKVTNPQQQMDVAKALKAICEKRDFVEKNFGTQETAEEEIPF